MLSWVIQITIISIIFIFLVHHLIHFFTATLTVPKIKDLVNSPTQKYEDIYNILKQQTNPEDYVIKNNSIKNQKHSNKNQDYTLIDLLPTKEEEDEPNMKNELKNFLKKQLHQSTTPDFSRYNI